MGRSLKKGPFVDEHLMKKLKLKLTTKGKSHQNLVTSFNDLPKFHWITQSQFMTDVNTYLFTSRRHGRSQTW